MQAGVRFPFWSDRAPFTLAIATAILVSDQLTKSWILFGLQMKPGDKITVFPFFDLFFVWNRGISYGLFQQETDIGRWALIIIGIVACVVLWIWINRGVSISFASGAACVIGGGIGNTIDRIAYGAVADFVSLHAFGYYWYIFNIADIAIVAGFVLLLYDMLWPRRTAE